MATPVSVIIPNYNHARYVGQAIESVLAQHHPDVEIIVVDDGSSDDSRAVIGRFGTRVRAIFQENRGLSAARNTGIGAANGSYIAVLDADDLYEPDFASTLAPFLDANPQAEAVYCGYRFVNDDNQALPQQEARLVPPEELHQALVDGNFLVPEAILVRRRCYEQVGPFDESLSALEDLDMWLRITRHHTVLGTPKLLTRHRVLAGSMSTDPARQTRNRLAVIRKHFGPEPANDFEWTEAQRRGTGKPTWPRRSSIFKRATRGVPMRVSGPWPGHAPTR